MGCGEVSLNRIENPIFVLLSVRCFQGQPLYILLQFSRREGPDRRDNTQIDMCSWRRTFAICRYALLHSNDCNRPEKALFRLQVCLDYTGLFVICRDLQPVQHYIKHTETQEGANERPCAMKSRTIMRYI